MKQIKNLKYAKKNCGKLILIAEELSACKQIARLKFRINNLKQSSSCLSLLVKPSSFLAISRSNEDSTFTVVNKTKTKWYTRNPKFDRIELKVRTLCNADFDRTIKFDVMDYSSTGDHKLIGSVQTSLNQLKNKSNTKFEVIII